MLYTAYHCLRDNKIGSLVTQVLLSSAVKLFWCCLLIFQTKICNFSQVVGLWKSNTVNWLAWKPELFIVWRCVFCLWVMLCCSYICVRSYFLFTSVLYILSLDWCHHKLFSVDSFVDSFPLLLCNIKRGQLHVSCKFAPGIVYLNRNGNSATFPSYVCNAKKILKSCFILHKME